MDLQRFFALRTGPHDLPDGEPAELVLHELGTLKVPSGLLAIADTTSLEAPVVVPIPAGEYAVRLTVVQVDESYDLGMKREAYISLVISDKVTVALSPAPVEAATREWRDEPAGGIAGISGLHGVTTGSLGSVTLADAEAIELGMPGGPDTWYDSVISVGDGTGWFERMDTEEEGPRGTVNAPFPNATDGTNAVAVITRSGKLFPLLASHDESEQLTGIHVDLLVTGELSEELGAFDGISQHAVDYFEDIERERSRKEAAEAKKGRGIFGWFRGK